MRILKEPLPVGDPNIMDELEQLRVKCAELCGWARSQIGGVKSWKRILGVLHEASCSDYCRSYDAIMPEIKRLTPYERSKLVLHLFDIRGEVDTLSAEPWQLCEAFIRTKTEAE